jgi:hypothetical protein
MTAVEEFLSLFVGEQPRLDPQLADKSNVKIVVDSLTCHLKVDSYLLCHLSDIEAGRNKQSNFPANYFRKQLLYLYLIEIFLASYFPSSHMI